MIKTGELTKLTPPTIGHHMLLKYAVKLIFNLYMLLNTFVSMLYASFGHIGALYNVVDVHLCEKVTNFMIKSGHRFYAYIVIQYIE